MPLRTSFVLRIAAPAGLNATSGAVKKQNLSHAERMRLPKPAAVGACAARHSSCWVFATLRAITAHQHASLVEHMCLLRAAGGCAVQCGSCWAFATTGAIEGANSLYTHKMTSLSEQGVGTQGA